MSPTVGYPRKRHRTRRRMVQAGMAALAERGPAGVTAGGVAAAAGVATGTFYNHFPTVDDFFNAIAQDVARGLEIGKTTLTDSENDPAARVAIGVMQLLDMADNDAIAASAFVTLVAARPDFRARVRSLVHDVISEGVDAGRFDVPADSATTNAVLGAGLQSMRSLFLGESSHAEAAGVTRLILRLLGVPANEIDSLVARATTVSG